MIQVECFKWCGAICDGFYKVSTKSDLERVLRKEVPKMSRVVVTDDNYHMYELMDVSEIPDVLRQL